MKLTIAIRTLRFVLWLVALAAVFLLSAVPTQTVQAAFPGTNGQICFVFINSADPAGFDIWVSNPDGSKQVQVTTQAGNDCDWSPDGSKIAFDYFDGQADQIGTVSPTGAGFVQLTTPENVFHGEPAWSPDGSRIAIESDNGNFPAGEGIYTIDASTPDSPLSRVTTNPFSSIDTNPRWSPDGQWIVFTRYKLSMTIVHRSPSAPPGVSALFLVHPDGTGLRQLTRWGLSADQADWSPDGSAIVFVDSAGLPVAGDIYTIQLNGSGLKLVVNSGVVKQGGAVGHPRWSPDGTKIIFHGSFGGVSVIPAPSPFGMWTVNPDGSGLTAIPAFSGVVAGNPAWGTHPLQ